jgi:LysM repeat protein
MKKLITFVFALFIFISAFSQSADLIINNGPKGLYLTHKVAPKEGLFPIGRMYNVHPRHIANFNGIDFNKGLSIGQQINIPLSDTNFSQTVNKGVPVYYKVTEKESLANIAVKNRAQISNLRAWNNLTTDNASPGTKLIIGFLITNELQDKVVTITPKTIIEEPSVSDVKKSETLKKQTEEPKKDVDVKTEPVVNKEAEIKKEEPKKIEPEIKKEDPPVVKEELKKTDAVIVNQQEKIIDDGTGYFKNNFLQQVKTNPLTKEQTVTSSIFKTTSGWQDGKYYLLINGVEPGTIVRLTNPSNNKTVFAKVLYSMDKIRQNQGVDMRISDAAAARLSINETDKFILKMNY